jgi:hypothetical protein
VTHTYATLQVSRSTFDEIAAKLSDAGYEPAFDVDASNEPVIDMHGIGLVASTASPANTFELKDGATINLAAPWTFPDRSRT